MNEETAIIEAIARTIFEQNKDWDEPGWDWYVDNDRLSPAMDGEFATAQVI